jgi:hypothetical protein
VCTFYKVAYITAKYVTQAWELLLVKSFDATRFSKGIFVHLNVNWKHRFLFVVCKLWNHVFHLLLGCIIHHTSLGVHLISPTFKHLSLFPYSI